MEENSIASKHDENNLKPVLSIREFYLFIDNIVERMNTIEQNYGGMDANIGFTIDTIRTIIEDEAETKIETLYREASE